jgi:inner membrane protein involved in colicin E2 resistance
MSELTNIDYKKILDFYNKPRSKRLLKTQAEKLLVSKLCRCIKKVDKKNEARAIGICTKSIINSKGLIRGKFTCKKRQEIYLKKKTRKIRK